MPKSKEFDRGGDTDVKDVVTKSGPLGMLPIFYIVLSILIVIALALWWATR